MKRLCAEKHVTPAYLERRCKEVVPGWHIGPLPAAKRVFKPEEKQTRIAYCKKALAAPREFFQSTVFCDEFKCWRRPVCLPAIWIAGRRRPNPLARDRRWRPRKTGYPLMHFLYGVHWKLGVFGPYWLSDTKGWRHANRYLVRTCPHVCLMGALPPAGQSWVARL